MDIFMKENGVGRCINESLDEALFSWGFDPENYEKWLMKHLRHYIYPDGTQLYAIINNNGTPVVKLLEVSRMLPPSMGFRITKYLA